MDLTISLPTMFILGLAGMALCYAFLIACEKIWGQIDDLHYRSRFSFLVRVFVCSSHPSRMVL